MIAPHVKSLRRQAQNFSYFASVLCQHCKKVVPFDQTSSSNSSSFSGLVIPLPSSRLTSSPKCTSFGIQNIRHVSRQEQPDSNESKILKGNKTDSSVREEIEEKDENKELTHMKMEELLLETLTENRETVKCVPIVPGKGPPPDPPLDCCMSGCANCVWIKYAEEMRDYYCEEGLEKAWKDIEKIEDANLKAYLKLELSFMTK